MIEEVSLGELSAKVWADFEAPIQRVLNDPDRQRDDDPELWRRVVGSIIAESMMLYPKMGFRRRVLAQVGACSHWLRPHQTRQKIAGGFAHPYGYGDGNYGFSRQGLPQFDWSLLWLLNEDCSRWLPVSRRSGKRPLVLRVALPTRSRRHLQAAVHTRWEPGTPADPRQKVDNLYFFRKKENRWQRVAEIFDKSQWTRQQE